MERNTAHTDKRNTADDHHQLLALTVHRHKNTANVVLTIYAETPNFATSKKVEQQPLKKTGDTEKPYE